MPSKHLREGCFVTIQVMWDIRSIGYRLRLGKGAWYKDRGYEAGSYIRTETMGKDTGCG